MRNHIPLFGMVSGVFVCASCAVRCACGAVAWLIKSLPHRYRPGLYFLDLRSLLAETNLNLSSGKIVICPIEFLRRFAHLSKSKLTYHCKNRVFVVYNSIYWYWYNTIEVRG